MIKLSRTKSKRKEGINNKIQNLMRKKKTIKSNNDISKILKINRMNENLSNKLFSMRIG